MTPIPGSEPDSLPGLASGGLGPARKGLRLGPGWPWGDSGLGRVLPQLRRELGPGPHGQGQRDPRGDITRRLCSFLESASCTGREQGWGKSPANGLPPLQGPS